jgi:signal transduction histidine kinase
VAAVAVAIAFAPLRARAHRLVDRLFYGQRSDPYATLHDLGRRLSATAPGEVLSGVVDVVSSTLRLPYVAIERAHDGSVLASTGVPGASVDRWPLTYEGRIDAHLVASPRRGEDAFDERDRQLLDDVARHAGAPVHAEALTADLLASRQHLVSTREEERRRLRRELHDGLGPVLTSIGLNIDAARTRLASGGDGADALLTDAKHATSQAIGDLRVVVHGLRPPALDDLGLLGALRTQTDRLASSAGLHVELDVDACAIASLPAAVEVVVYRTVIEAVTNTARHAGATTCTVRIRTTATRVLRVEITDDGPSNGAHPWTPGVGLTAMRERAEELGGSFRAGPTEPCGARVVVDIPLATVAP